MPGFLSSRPNWLPPTSHPQAIVAPRPRFQGGGGANSLSGEGAGGANSDEETDTLEL